MFNFARRNARWLLGAFLLTTFSGFGQTFFISIWSSEIRAAFSLSHGEFGMVYMVATLASASVLPFVGRLVDVASVAKASAIVIAMLTIAALLMSYANSLPMLVLSIFLLRLFGQGMMTHTAMTAMGRWYAAHRGKAVSLATIGHQCSEAIMPALFVALATWIGWRESWLIAGGVLLFIALPVIYLLMRVERVPRSDIDPTESKTALRHWTRPEMLRDPLFWLASAGVLAPAFIGTSIFFHQDHLIEINNWPPALYYNSFALMALTTLTVSLTMGLAIDRWSAVQLLPLFMVPLAMACFLLGTSSAPSTVILFMILLGTSYGITSTLFGALWPEIYGTLHLGSLRSIIMAMMVLASALGPGVTGLLLDLGISFSRQLIFMGIFCVAAAVLMTGVSRGLRSRLVGEHGHGAA